MGRFKRVQQAWALLIVFCTSPVLAADDIYLERTPLPARLIPMYKPCVYQNSEFACFDREAVIQLNTLELQAKYWHSQWLYLKSNRDFQEKQHANLLQRLDLQIEAETRDAKYIEKLNAQLKKEIEAKNEWRVKAENPPTWPLWVGGTALAIGIGSFLGGWLGR